MRTFKIDTAASAELIAADSGGKRIRVTSITLFVASEVTVQFKSGGTSGTALTGAMTLEKGTPLSHDYAVPNATEKPGYFETAPGENLYLTLGSGVQASGFGTYELVN